MNPDAPDESREPAAGPGEVERLRAEHERLHHELETIQGQLRDLSTRLDTLAQPPRREVRPRKRLAKGPDDDEALHAAAIEAAPPPVPEPKPAPVNDPPPEPETEAALATDPEAAPGAADAPPAAGTASPEPDPAPADPLQEAAPAAAPTPTPKGESLESTWVPFLLPIIGAVLFLLTLVFAGNYLYYEFFVDLSKGMKVALLYAVCAVVLGLGAWLETMSGRLPRLGTILGAAGLGGLYYVSFAAHFTEALRVIESPVTAGVLLLAWSGLALFLAEWRRSQELGVAAIALAYFSTAIGPVGWFGAGSNLLLAAVSVALVLRHRWEVLGMVSLGGVYASFLLNSIIGVSLVSGADPLAAWLAAPVEGVWIGLISLTAYWLTFATGSFFARQELMAQQLRMVMLTLNNLLWVGWGCLLMGRLDLPGQIDVFLLMAGGLMLAASCLARWVWASAKPVAEAYLGQGLTVFTIGLMLAASGTVQALLLTAELMIVLVLATTFRHRLLRYATLAIVPLVTGTTLLALKLEEIAPWASLTVAAALIFAGWWAKFHRASTSWRQEQVDWLTANGIGLLTCALVTHFTGMPRLLLLTAEFVFVLLFAVSSTSYLLRVASHVLATIVLAVGGGLMLLGGVYYAVLVSVVALFWAAWWAQHQTLAVNRWTPADIGWLSALALALNYQWLKELVPTLYFWPVLGTLALIATLGTRLHRIPVLTYLSQLYFLLAVTNLFGPLYNYVPAAADNLPGWQPALLIAVGLALSAWWQRTTDLRNTDFSLAMRLIDAAAVVALFYLWVEPRLSTEMWMVAASLLTLALSAYGVSRREWLLAAFGQSLVLVAVGELFWRAGTTVAWPAALVPTATLVGIAMTAEWACRTRLLSQRGEQTSVPEEWLGLVRYVATGYRMVTVFLAVRLVNAYVPAPEQAWVFALLGFALLATGGWRLNGLRAAGVLLYFLLALVKWFVPMSPEPHLYWANWLALLLILAAPVFTRRARAHLDPLPEQADTIRREKRDWEAAAVWLLRLLGVLMLWLQASRLGETFWGAQYLTIAWALTALAVLAGGFAVRERLLRWLGLGILAATLLRFLVFDLWGFQTFYQVVSAGALTAVVLLLAFLYNKYADRFRQWL